jgi:DNA gyrase/topoisomerase IV subunit A
MDGSVIKMKRTKKNSAVSMIAPSTPQPTLLDVSSSDFVDQASREYAIYTAQHRAIPSSCDGFKDGQRKAMWLMRNKRDKIKTVSLSGELISSNLYNHGDASASETISRLAAPYMNNVPLLDGVGAFGTRVAPDSWGAPRYTYVKKGSAAERLLYTDLDIVPLKPNYDSSNMEPVHFLPLIPLALLNGVSGIAVGWSTEILPHSLDSIVQATVAAIEGKTIPRLMPSFANMDVGVVATGDNSYEFVGKVTITGDTTAVVTELPPDLSLERFRARLNQMEEDDQIHSYVDRSTKNILVEIRFKRGVLANFTDLTLAAHLKLKSKTTQRIVVLDFDSAGIRQYEHAEELVSNFVVWRLSWYQKRIERQIAVLVKDLNFALAVKACVDAALPKFLPTASNKGEVESKIRSIVEGIDVDEAQFDRLVSFPSYRWAKDSVSKVEKEIVELGEKIVSLEILLTNPKKIKDIYKKEVLDLLK